MSQSPAHQILAMATPPDWNQPGEYEAKSANLDDVDQPVEWRSHKSARDLDEQACASKVLNFAHALKEYAQSHHYPSDFWAAYDMPATPRHPGSHKLIIHHTIRDRLPTLYLIPAARRPKNRRLSTPPSYDQIKERA